MATLLEIIDELQTVLDAIAPPTYLYNINNVLLGRPNLIDDNQVFSVAGINIDDTFTSNVLEMWTIDVENVQASQLTTVVNKAVYNIVVDGFFAYLPQDFILHTVNNHNGFQVFWSKCDSIIREFGKGSNYQLPNAGVPTLTVRDDHGGALIQTMIGDRMAHAATLRFPGITTEFAE